MGKHLAIEPPTVEHTNPVECLGNRKNNMVMLYCQNTFDSVFYPKTVFNSLAFGAVPVSATVVSYMLPATMITAIFMSPQSRCTAFGQSIEDS